MFEDLLTMMTVNELNLKRLKRIYSAWLVVYILIIIYHFYFIVTTTMELQEMSNCEHEYYNQTLYLLASTSIGLIFEISSVVTGKFVEGN